MYVWCKAILFHLVLEDETHKGKTTFANFKNIVWHKAFLKILESIEPLSKTGYWHKDIIDHIQNNMQWPQHKGESPNLYAQFVWFQKQNYLTRPMEAEKEEILKSQGLWPVNGLDSTTWVKYMGSMNALDMLFPALSLLKLASQLSVHVQAIVVYFNSPMNPMELEMYHQIKNAIGVNPTFYESLFTVNANTAVELLSVNCLISTSVSVLNMCYIQIHKVLQDDSQQEVHNLGELIFLVDSIYFFAFHHYGGFVLNFDPVCYGCIYCLTHYKWRYVRRWTTSYGVLPVWCWGEGKFDPHLIFLKT
ncbi:hypothetical protein SERLADRAFT_404715 [Serpula lacrymans var. lacrymans S7.9]|uniref:Uncharacterized protein n=1 Tax=Serpula lacrymans var. lacrymans (strain S7.9) TaxID=578457 RepID=F8NEJ6_SERL9|nr:uncharacterized protein SERLADRAFT_404715 [Serpula lacrymans var. lacrymans S7.9]EGO30630.1 hypothetical protein SERLADRAFT_404715 [Serpula lacrymans var. lacrymans S7.9]